MVAVVGVPDAIFGERVCAVVEVRSGWEALQLADVTGHLAARGVTKEWWPERLLVVDALLEEMAEVAPQRPIAGPARLQFSRRLTRLVKTRRIGFAGRRSCRSRPARLRATADF